MKQKLLNGLNTISENLVLFDFIDLGPLGRVHSEFSSLSRLASDSGNEEIAIAFSELAGITEKLVIDENVDMQQGVQHLNELTTLLSEHVVSNEAIDDIGEQFFKLINPDPQDTISNDDIDDIGLLAEFSSSFQKDPEVSQDFVNEALDHLENCMPALLELERTPDDADCINLVFRCFHSIKGVAGFLCLDTIRTIAHLSEDILDKVRSGQARYTREISNLVLESSDALKAMTEQFSRIITGSKPENMSIDANRLKQRLKDTINNISNNNIHAPGDPTSMPKLEVGSPSSPKSSRQQGIRDFAGRNEVIKVNANRLNRLIDIIGELVIAETIVLESEETRSHVNPGYLRKLNQLDKITRELQTMGMGMRMVAVKPTFNNMARIVRDLAEKQSKKIEFSMAGEDTEIDKNIVDKLGDPLVHMIRNAVDHGIESSPEEREDGGKNPVAKIEIRAFHRGGSICIEIEDDGKGINPDVIFEKAVQKGVVDPDANLSRSEIINLIFAPGFSTAENVTDISGRGVGMDVVKRNISELNGTVEVSSEPGRGSVFCIRLPLTLAIIDGMIVRLGNERFIVPTLSISRAVNITSSMIHRVKEREFVFHQERNIPVYRLAKFLGSEPQDDTANALMLILEDEDNSVSGLIVDELVGKQQIVIKSLGEAFRNVDGYSGCAILSDGSVGLIIDVSNVIKSYDNW